MPLDDHVDARGSPFSDGEPVAAVDRNAPTRPRTVKSLFTLLREALEAGDTRIARQLVDELERLSEQEADRVERVLGSLGVQRGILGDR
jgi:hypothetical protein